MTAHEAETGVKCSLHRVPFFLESDYIDQPEGWWEPHETRMVRKFGSKEAFESVKVSHRLMPRAVEAGLDAEGWTEERLGKRRQSPTLRAHRLVAWIDGTRGWEAAEAAYKVLGHGHFVESALLNDMELLRAAAVAAGADADGAENYLRSDRGEAAVLSAVDAVHRLGIHSIPTLFINGRLVCSGAAGAEEVLSALRRAPRGAKRAFALEAL